ncbi:MAG: hypothetical protein MZV63_72185 [Marinilabiliales bacterium]|nr:hypothetical protein [Marinilabiliales bacterium]
MFSGCGGSTVVKDAQVKVPFSVYVTEAWKLIIHFVTQKQFEKCDDATERLLPEKNAGATMPCWYSGYVLMFAMVVGFLPWFQTDNIYPIYHPQLAGYYATIVLLYGGFDILWSRIKQGTSVPPLLAPERLDLPHPAYLDHGWRYSGSYLPLSRSASGHLLHLRGASWSS